MALHLFFGGSVTHTGQPVGLRASGRQSPHRKSSARAWVHALGGVGCSRASAVVFGAVEGQKRRGVARAIGESQIQGACL